MKPYQLTALVIASSVLIGGVATNLFFPTPSDANPEILISQNTQRSGNFVTASRNYPTRGRANIVQENGRYYLEFNSAFTTTNAPDIVVILYRGKQVPPKIAEASYITLAPLQRVNGAQRYAIPSNVNIQDFSSVAIWCRQFNITFGYASL